MASITVLLCAVDGLRVGEALKFQLADKLAAREGQYIQIACRHHCRLLVPIRSAVVRAVDRLAVGEALVFQLVDEALIGKRHYRQILLRRLQGIALAERGGGAGALLRFIVGHLHFAVGNVLALAALAHVEDRHVVHGDLAGHGVKISQNQRIRIAKFHGI